MPEPIFELPGLRAIVQRVAYMPALEAPPDRPHPFVYFITIQNDSQETVVIKGRKWVVTDSEGHVIVVEGDGVVGKFPQLRPGQKFSYNSYHVVASDSIAKGAFFGVTASGSRVFTSVPAFSMEIPEQQVSEEISGLGE